MALKEKEREAMCIGLVRSGFLCPPLLLLKCVSVRLASPNCNLGSARCGEGTGIPDLLWAHMN